MKSEIGVNITIDIVSKLRKINEGKTFSDDLVVITELFQNSQRANAKNVYIEVGEGKLAFKDDGCGCKEITDILTLDHSAWASTDEGFGIGLWSWLSVKSVTGINIQSDIWEMSITTKQIFEDNNLKAKTTLSKDNKIKGFQVTIFSDFFNGDTCEIEERIISDGEMQLFNVFLNGEFILKKDLHGEVEGEYKKCFSNKYFEATFVPVRWDYPNIYYERRRIDNFYPTEYLKGVIEVKKNALTLQEPDRKNVIRDDKRRKFIEKLDECRKEVYLDIVKDGDNRVIDEFSNQIDRVLTVKDYEKYLLVDDLILEVEEETRNVEDITSMNKLNSFNRLVEVVKELNSATQLSLTDNRSEEDQQQIVATLLNKNSDTHKWVKTSVDDWEVDNYVELKEDNIEEVLNKYSYVSVGDTFYKKVNVSDYREMFESEDEEITSSLKVRNIKKKKKKESLRSIIRRTNKKVWVKASEIEDYTDLIAKVEYYGVKVFISRNILHSNVFMENNVSYITEIESGIEKTNIKWDVELKTKKEERFIELLQPICRYYNLPINTFKIGYLKLLIETSLDDRVINREIIENRKGSIKIYGVTDGNDIILDRRALGLQRFNLTGSYFGINEVKALMANLMTIAHELAHLLYSTEDNTKEHRESEDKIYEELVNLYLAL